MPGPAQTRAVRTYRKRLAEKGLHRFEVIGRDADRELVRVLARLLAEDSYASRALREAATRIIDDDDRRGTILEALRRSPLVGTSVDFVHQRLDRRLPDLQPPARPESEP